MKFDFSFHVGEKVRFYKYTTCALREMELNETGIITDIIRNGSRGSVFLGVRWEKKKDARHDCKGTASMGMDGMFVTMRSYEYKKEEEKMRFKFKKFQDGDRIVYMGPDKDGPKEGDVGTVMGKPPHLEFSIEKDSKGSLLYVVEFDGAVGYDCPYIDERGEEKITEDDRGWVTPEVYMYPCHDPVGV